MRPAPEGCTDPDPITAPSAAGSDQTLTASATVVLPFSYQIIATNRPTKFYASRSSRWPERRLRDRSHLRTTAHAGSANVPDRSRERWRRGSATLVITNHRGFPPVAAPWSGARSWPTGIPKPGSATLPDFRTSGLRVHRRHAARLAESDEGRPAGHHPHNLTAAVITRGLCQRGPGSQVAAQRLFQGGWTHVAWLVLASFLL